MTRPRLALLIATCGLAVILFAACFQRAVADDAAPTGSPFKNVKILTNVTSKAEMRDAMKKQAASLGVKCVHCHVPGKFDLDEKPEKEKARKMLRMVAELNTKYFADEDDAKVTCFTCHAGKEKPDNDIPAALLAPDGDSFEPAK
jgi:sugar phosphate isomerase/epimerase